MRSVLKSDHSHKDTSNIDSASQIITLNQADTLATNCATLNIERKTWRSRYEPQRKKMFASLRRSRWHSTE